MRRLVLRYFALGLLAIGCLLVGRERAMGQITSSMPFEHPVLLNPSLVGSGDGIRINSVYRNQWLNIKSPYNTVGATYDMHFGLYDNHNIGVSILDDIEGPGVLHHAGTYLYYAYMLDVTYDFRLRLGLQAGGIMKMTNYNKLIFPDMVGEEGGSPLAYANQVQFTPDFGLGVSTDYLGWYFGAAVHHLTEPKYDVRVANYLRTPRRYTVHLRKDFNLNARHRFAPPLLLSPLMMMTYQKDDLKVAVGGQVQYLGLRAGIWLRESADFASHNVSAMFGWTGSWFGIAYSYGVGIMPEGFFGLNTSVHELSLSLLINQGRRAGLSKTYGRHGKRKRYVHYSRRRTGAARRRRRYRVR